MRRLAALVVLLALGCDGPAPRPIDDAATADDAGSVARDAGIDAAPVDAAVSCPVTLPSPLALTLAHGAFAGSGHPDVAVHVPPGYDACAPQGAIVYFHGFHNCVLNTIGDVDTECTPGAGTRTAHRLIAQLDDAHVNAMLIAVEVAYDEASGATGALSSANGLRALLDELFADHLSAMLGRPTTLADLDTVVLASHSGGYTAVARGLDSGGLPHVDEVMLLDSLYGELTAYDDYTVNALDAFDPLGEGRRFAVVYTDGGGTDANSRALGDRIQTGLAAIGRADWLLYDDTTATLDAPAFAHPLLVKHSMLSHDGVVLYYFERLVAAAGFAPLP
jgi:hypothetical protein